MKRPCDWILAMPTPTTTLEFFWRSRGNFGWRSKIFWLPSPFVTTFPMHEGISKTPGNSLGP